MAVRVTMNNSREGRNGVFLAKHLDGPQGKAAKLGGLGYTWSRYKGMTFEDSEARFYSEHFTAGLEAQNEIHRRKRQKKRIKTMDQYRENRLWCPESSLFYLGDKYQNAGAKALQSVVVEFWKWRRDRFPQVVSLDLAVHVEDGAPHIHERHVWVAHDDAGNEVVCQEAALREMGVLPPDPTKPVSRYNNAKMTYTQICREKMMQIAKAHGIEVIEKPREAGKSGLSQEAFRTQAEQRHQDEARAAVKEAEKEAESLEGAIFAAKQEMDDIGEYHRWKAARDAERAQEARKAREVEEQARKAAEAAREAEKARQEQEARERARAAQEARQRAVEAAKEEEARKRAETPEEAVERLRRAAQAKARATLHQTPAMERLNRETSKRHSEDNVMTPEEADAWMASLLDNL